MHRVLGSNLIGAILAILLWVIVAWFVYWILRLFANGYYQMYLD